MACITDDATADAAVGVGVEPLAATPTRRVCGNPAALAKSVFASRDTREVGLQASLKALMLMDRLRFIRTLDIAFHLYANRTFTAALAAANNLLKRLTRNGFVNAHTARVGGLRIYGISQRGVNLLRDHTGYEAKAHRSLRDVKNPEHRLWSNLIVVAAEARGLSGMTESEVLRFERNAGEVVSDGGGGERVIPRKLLTVANQKKPGERKGLTPDALLTYGTDRRVWLEIDTSKRSSARTGELKSLVRSISTILGGGSVLSRIVFFAKERRSYTHIFGVLRKQSEESIERASTYLSPTKHEGTFDAWYRPSISEDRPGQTAQDRRCGVVQVLMLPDIRGKGEGWYDQDWLPFAQCDEQLWSPIPGREKNGAGHQ
jgi:hypothetical protein